MAAHRKHPARDDAKYLKLRRDGLSIRAIAAECDTSVWTVHTGIRAARDLEAAEASLKEEPTYGPKLELRFGSSCKAVPKCKDVHPNGPIPKDDPGCCCDCHQSGFDHIYGPPRPSPKPRLAAGTASSPKQKTTPSPRVLKQARRLAKGA